tara:strand:- start:2212 stop:2418 length:207 start_codon:yes stop_codon:yes gene_type:complete
MFVTLIAEGQTPREYNLSKLDYEFFDHLDSLINSDVPYEVEDALTGETLLCDTKRFYNALRERAATSN